MQIEYLSQKKEENREKIEELEYEIGQLKRKRNEYIKNADVLKKETCTNAELFSPRNYRLQNREKLEQVVSAIKEIETELEIYEQQLENLQGRQAECVKMLTEAEKSEFDTMEEASKSEEMKKTIVAGKENEQLESDAMTDNQTRQLESDTMTDADETVCVKTNDTVGEIVDEEKIQPSIWIQELKSDDSTTVETDVFDKTEKQFLTSEDKTDDISICKNQQEEKQGYDFDEVIQERALATSRIADGLKKLQLRQDFTDTIEYQMVKKENDTVESKQTELETAYNDVSPTEASPVTAAAEMSPVTDQTEMEIKSEEVIILESERKKEREFLEQVYLKVERSLALLNGNRNVCKKELQQVKRMIYDYVQKIS